MPSFDVVKTPSAKALRKGAPQRRFPNEPRTSSKEESIQLATVAVLPSNLVACHTPSPILKGMSSMAATLLTADEYIATGETRQRWTQLINGEVIVNSPTIRHQKIVRFIEFALESWTRLQPGRGMSLGQVDAKIDASNVLAPDVVWASEGRIPADGTHLDFVPELVVEVRSPSTWRNDTTVKFQKYEAAGVNELWMVDTASNTVFVYRRSAPSSNTFDVALALESGDTLTSQLLEDFAIDVTTLFDR
jgi:Uma2 family endonuclease